MYVCTCWLTTCINRQWPQHIMYIYMYVAHLLQIGLLFVFAYTEGQQLQVKKTENLKPYIRILPYWKPYIRNLTCIVLKTLHWKPYTLLKPYWVRNSIAHLLQIGLLFVFAYWRPTTTDKKLKPSLLKTLHRNRTPYWNLTLETLHISYWKHYWVRNPREPWTDMPTSHQLPA